MRVKALLLLSLVFVSSGSGNEISDANKTFIPTKEWKVIEEGQSIPRGLHVRINLETGKKEAKLIDSDDNTKEKSSSLSVVEREDHSTQDSLESSQLRLKEALKNIPYDDFEYSEEKIKEITKKFKSSEKIKQELADMNMHIKADFEIITELCSKYEKINVENNIRLDDLNVVFDDLEYLLHQIDNANDFISSGGLEKIIIPNLRNKTIPELKINSIILLGTLTQNNPNGQIAVFDKNVGSSLMQLISQSSSTTSTKELSSILYALGGLLRNFPLAQVELLNKSGLNMLVDLLGKNVDYKIKIKCLGLITDLIREYNEVTGSAGNGDVNKIKQYNAINIKGRLSADTEYCTIVDDLLNMHRHNYLDSLYTADDILNVLIMSKDICHSVWSKSPLFRHTLLVIRSKYDQLKDGTDYGDLTELLGKLEHLHEFLFSYLVIKDEL